MDKIVIPLVGKGPNCSLLISSVVNPGNENGLETASTISTTTSPPSTSPQAGMC